MKKNSLLFFCTVLYHLLIGQNYEPQILILAPNETKIEKSLKKEVSNISETLKNSLTDLEQINNYLSSSEFLGQSDNIQQMIRSEIEFSKDMDFFKQISSMSAQYLAYRFFEKFPNVLIMLSSEKSYDKMPGFRETYSEGELRYILSFPSVEVCKNKSIPYASITVQLFDRSIEANVLDKTYLGHWRNPGFEFACKDSTLNCTLNNALSNALSDIIRIVESNNPTLQRERQLSRDRLNALLDDYLTGNINIQVLEDAIPKSDSTISLSDCYQTINDASESKFVAFFIKRISPRNFKLLTESKTDQNVKIISPKDIKEQGFLDEIPRTYAYIVKGVRYDNKWFYEKSNVTYFESESLHQGKKEYFNNLQKWNFFKEGTTEFNPDFWETSLFEKVRDLKKDPEWNKYGDDMWMTTEINNREYIGLYEIVAKVLRERNIMLNSDFEAYMKKEVFNKFYDELRSSSPDQYAEISAHKIICSKNRNIALNPVLITDKEKVKTIHYFVAFKESLEIYEWNYFDPTEVPTKFYGSEVVNQIGSLTDWNFSVDNLNDRAFWDNYVLKRDKGVYKYLSAIK